MNYPTQHRILDAAEKLFAEQGFEATSLRAITAEAEVNLAAVNYHFQSKEALLEAVVGRRAEPINTRRLELLTQRETEAGGNPLEVEQILEAFLLPVMECGDRVPRLMIRMMALESSAIFQRLFEKYFKPVVFRFTAAIRRAVPHLSPEEALMRMQFVIGAFAQMLATRRVMEIVSEGRIAARSPQIAARRLIHFAAAGLRAPACEEIHVSE